MADLLMRDINKIYPGGFQAVYDFNMEIKHGEFVVLVGPSGCGKSTMLRMIAGLETITSGDLKFDDKVVNNVAPSDRDIAMVFQNYALYGNMTVYENMGFSLNIRHENGEVIHDRVMEAADVVEMKPWLNRKPKNLSGGQRQRVALGRSIVRDSSVFLMDEPLSNLDAKLRDQTRKELVNLHKELNSTFIYVTHDQTEAMAMADRIVVMNKGVVQQIGTPIEVYREPENMFVGSFIGSPAMNFIEGRIENGHFIAGEHKLEIPEGKLKLVEKYDGKKIVLGARPENFSVKKIVMDTFKHAHLNLKIDVSELLGHEYIVYSELAGQKVIARIDARHAVSNGEYLELALDMNKIHFFDIETEMRIK